MARDLVSDLAVCNSRTGGKWRGAQSPFDQAGLAATIAIQIAMESVPGNDYANAVFCAEAAEGWHEAITRARDAEDEVRRLRFIVGEQEAAIAELKTPSRKPKTNG